MKPLYIIPARGGSKGIPRKNIKPLGGRPLIAYSIDVARQLACDPASIIVSTDDEEIASVAVACGVGMPYRRSALLATDTAGSREVILDAMSWADAQGIVYDCIVLLQPTSPLRTADDVNKCLERYAANDVDMVVTVVASDANPYYNLFETNTDGMLHISKGDGSYTRRQDAPPVYEYNGAVYVINPVSIRKMSMGAFPSVLPVVMDSDRSIDLDTPLDWLIAETIIKQKETTEE